MPAPRIFLCDRRGDAAGSARALHDEPAQRFGAEAVFIDVDDIHAGQPCSEVIEQAMTESKLLLVLIGKRWHGEREGAPPSLADADDPVWLVAAVAATWGLCAPSPRAAASAPDASPGSARPAIDGNWQADVSCDWPNSSFTERFVFAGEGAELRGSASFLGLPIGVLERRAVPGGLRFVTREREDSAEAVHRYTGRLAGAGTRFVMQTEGGASLQVPVEFSARRVV